MKLYVCLYSDDYRGPEHFFQKNYLFIHENFDFNLFVAIFSGNFDPYVLVTLPPLSQRKILMVLHTVVAPLVVVVTCQHVEHVLPKTCYILVYRQRIPAQNF